MAVRTTTRVMNYFDMHEIGNASDAVLVDSKVLDHACDEDEFVVEVTMADTLAEACNVWGIDFRPAT